MNSGQTGGQPGISTRRVSQHISERAILMAGQQFWNYAHSGLYRLERPRARKVLRSTKGDQRRRGWVGRIEVENANAAVLRREK